MSHPTRCAQVRELYVKRQFFRGLQVTILQQTPQAGISLASYKKLTETSWVPRPDWKVSGALGAAVNGFISGSVAKLFVQPADTVKKRLQASGFKVPTQSGLDSRSYDGICDCIRKTFKQE
eukprot:2248557-Amphidinium_carterae.2